MSRKKNKPSKQAKSAHLQSLLDRFLVVGVGASAGGLEAYKQFLSALSVNSGMAFVLVQHLDPKHDSLSTDILSRCTKMPVKEVKDGMLVQLNRVYVIPPNHGMEISGRFLKLIPRSEDRTQHMVIDLFFRSLALNQGQFAAGVILSGTGSDGTEGVISIKGEGGFTFAQAPKSAKFDSMPKSAIASGSVDFALTPQEIAQELMRIAEHRVRFLDASLLDGESMQSAQASRASDEEKSNRTEVFKLLQKVCHVDFTHYKSNTIQRRIERRVIMSRAENLDSYVKFLAKNPDEVKLLYNDILIHVTSFFRDPEVFAALSREVFPKLLSERPAGLPIRIWIPGCSTGEEVYSIAILLLEFLGERALDIPIQIFASDISEQDISKARTGEYSESISRDVSPERLNRYFTRTDSGHYKISKSIRDLCLFSRHDITIDPPFARMDFVSCRNLLIYFSVSLQKHVIPIFHYALVPRGILLLGRSETIGSFANLFSVLDKSNKIYERKNAPLALNLHFPTSTYVPGKQEIARKSPVFSKPDLPHFPNLDVQKIADLALQAEFPGVLINEEMEILQFRGKTSPFLELAAGPASYHLLKMVRPEVIPDLRALVQTAKKQGSSAVREKMRFKEGRKLLTFNLRVIPIKPSALSRDQYYYVLFENAEQSKLPKSRLSKKSSSSKERDLYVVELQKKLIANQESQHLLIERYESTQEDLSTANEELQSSNEELQSTNEELETAKEELQSSNEELTTVNDELQSRSIDQVQLGNDLINLLGSVEIPILMLDNDHRIRRFTPLAGKALNLIPTDIGRPIGDLKLNFTSPGIDLDLDDLVREVLETTRSKEVEVQNHKGYWFRLQARPYKTIDNRIDGVVIALVDIHALKQSLKEVRDARAEAEKANRGKDLFLATLSHELRTPLTSILSWAQMLKAGRLDLEKTRRGYTIIEESGKAQAQLINDLLDVSRIIAGKLSLELVETNPAEVLRAAIESVRVPAEVKAVSFETTFDETIGTVMADALRLQQVFWNLLSNAIKFSLPGAKVQIVLDRLSAKEGSPARLRIRVTDHGKGIDSTFLPQIFDRFSQEDSSSVRLHGGLGLGLAIVKNIVELHGGSVTAESRGNLQGSTFTVMLPIKSDRPLPRLFKPQSARAIDDIQLKGVRVLIVDDEPNTREAFAEILTSFGAETRATDSVREALFLLREFKPDILLSDIAMPGEDGYSLIRKIRTLSSEDGGKTPSIAVTAYAGAEDVKLALSAGFQVHIAKPVTGSRLVREIAQLVGR